MDAVVWFIVGKVFAWLLSNSEFLSQRFHETQKCSFKVPAPVEMEELKRDLFREGGRRF